MRVNIARTFYDRWTDAGGGGTTYPNFRILDKARIDTIVEYSWGTYGMNLVFDSATKTITRSSAGSFIQEGHKVGGTFTAVDTPTNDGDFTIAEITDDVITTVEALTSEDAPGSTLHGTTPLTDQDYSYNFLFNDAAETYYSLVDIAMQQKYTATGCDATDTDPITMVALGRSQAWNATHGITVQGVSFDDYIQKFKFIHYVRVTPMWLKGQDTNFTGIVPPEYYYMRFINKIGGKVTPENPNADYEGSSVSDQGVIGFFDEAAPGSVTKYTLESIEFDEDIDLNTVIDFTAVLRSSTANFTAATTKVQVAFFRCASDNAEYNFNTKTQFQNFLFDETWHAVGDMNNGINYGTDYQVLKDIDIQLTSDSLITITGQLDLATAIKDFLKTLNAADRKFAMVFTVQGAAVTTTRGTDRVAILGAFENFGWNQDNTGLTELVDYMRVFHFPEFGTNPKRTVATYEGDPFYIDVPFRVLKSVTDAVTMNKTGLQIVAVKDGEDDFVLEEKIFNTEFYRKLEHRQAIDIVESRGFPMATGELYNEASLQDALAFNTDTKFGYMLRCGFIARYEYWLTLIQASERINYPIFEDIEKSGYRWYDFIGSGWTLKAKWVCYTDDGTGHETFDWAYVDFDMKAFGASSTPSLTCTVQYFDSDGVEIFALEQDAVTRIVATFNGNFSILPDTYVKPAGFFAANNLSSRWRWANTERPSEDNNPFSAPDADPEANESWAGGGVRIDVFSPVKIVLSTDYDDTIENWGRYGSVLVYPRLTFKGEDIDCTIDDEETTLPILDSVGMALIDESCGS